MKPDKTHSTHATLTALAGAIGVPVHVIRAAKKAGAAGFAANGSVDSNKFLAWCLTKGKSFAPEISLESARARFAIARTKQIENEDLKANGVMLPGSFVGDAVRDAFQFGVVWLDDRLKQLSFIVSHVAQQDDEAAAQAEVHHQLQEDTKILKMQIARIESKLLAQLKAGPKPGEIETDVARAERLLRETCGKLSPSAKAELVAAIDNIFSSAGPTDEETTNGQNKLKK